MHTSCLSHHTLAMCFDEEPFHGAGLFSASVRGDCGVLSYPLRMAENLELGLWTTSRCVRLGFPARLGLEQYVSRFRNQICNGLIPVYVFDIPMIDKVFRMVLYLCRRTVASGAAQNDSQGHH